jgi:hypothetical protein
VSPGGLERRRVGRELGLVPDRGRQVLGVNHLDDDVGLDVDGFDVLLEHDVVAGLELPLAEHAEFRVGGHRGFGGNHGHGINPFSSLVAM